MNIPGYAAEASLYKTTQVYRHGGVPTTGSASYVVAAQNPCQQACESKLALTLKCCADGYPFNAPTWFWCNSINAFDCVDLGGTTFASCMKKCVTGGTGGGGGGGGLRPCCPTGSRCCGECVNLRGGGQSCEHGPCIGPHESCP